MKLLCEAYDEFSESLFTKYINTMFLWDYTCKTDNKYEVVSNEKRNEEFLRKCFLRTKRRSLFMAMMLLIARCDGEETLEKVEFPNEWNNWHEASSLYKGLIYKIFCGEQVYESYEDVFGTIEKAYLWKKESKIKKYINCTKNLIDNIN